MPAADRAAYLGFHAAIAGGARNGYLAELASGTRMRLAAFRGARFDTPDGMARSHAEHEEILGAILAGNCAVAAEAMRRISRRPGRRWRKRKRRGLAIRPGFLRCWRVRDLPA